MTVSGLPAPPDPYLEAVPLEWGSDWHIPELFRDTLPFLVIFRPRNKYLGSPLLPAPHEVAGPQTLALEGVCHPVLLPRCQRGNRGPEGRGLSTVKAFCP